LVNSKGKVVGRYEPEQQPEEMLNKIFFLLEEINKEIDIIDMYFAFSEESDYKR